MKKLNKIQIRIVVWLGIILFMMPNFSFGQFKRDTTPSFDSLTVEDDVDIDSVFFLVYNRWGKAINLPRNQTDSVWNYWNHIPAYADDKMYFTTGNTGSPARSAYWNINRNVGFDHGIHHMDLYRIKSNNIKYYASDRAYTTLHYNQTPQQTKSGTNINFGRSFDKKSGISIQYDRINDLGEFTHQKTRQTSVGLGMYYLPKPNKKFFFSYTSNNFTMEENGGIVSPEQFNDPLYDDRSLIDVQLTTTLSEIKEREARLTSSWNIGNSRDTVSRGISLIYDVQYNTFKYKYSDTKNDTGFYQQYLVHVEGLRATVENTRISNKAGVAVDYGTTSSFDGRLAAHLEHRFNRYVQDVSSKDITNLMLYGEFAQQLSKKINIRANLILDLGDQRGDYLLNGIVALRPFNGISLQGHLISQLKTPTGILSEFKTLESNIYSNTYVASKYNTIGGKFKYNRFGLHGEINNTIVTDHVYFSDQLEPTNISTTFNILQIKLGLTHKIGPLFTENHLYFQNSSNAQVPLPSYFTKHYVGAKWRLFKQRLNLDTGIDGIILPDFKGYGYFPLIGQFYPDRSIIPYQYTVNGIIGLRVDQFNIYIKFENMHTIWEDTPRYMIENYPIYDYRVRIGFRWLLRG